MNPMRNIFPTIVLGVLFFTMACGGGASGGGGSGGSASTTSLESSNPLHTNTPILTQEEIATDITVENLISLEDQNFFQSQIWNPIMSQSCITCHNAQGLAQNTRLILQDSSQQGYMDTNLKTVATVAAIEEDGGSLLLLKPSNQVSHFGGEQIVTGSTEYQNFEELVERLTPSALALTQDPTPSAETVRMILSTNAETLRKAALSLAGRLPTPEEEEQVRQGGDTALETVLDQLLSEENFLIRMQEIYNDLLLTDRYIYYGADVLTEEAYPEKHWFDQFEEVDVEKWERLREYTNYGMAREPLALIAHVVRENRPFTEILTANYLMVTPYSARSYGLEEGRFQDNDDPDLIDFKQFYEARLPGIPHAGILTSFMFLDRYPTTDSNRNRRRSRTVYKVFLGTDILEMAQQPVDTTLIVDGNPTLTNPQCTVCHSVVDPIAGAFQNWSNPGDILYEVQEWFEDMRKPGFSETELIPESSSPQSLQWLAQQIAHDSRFAKATVVHMYRGFVGKDLFSPPNANDSDYSNLLKAYQDQAQFIDNLAQQFIASNYNLKEVVKGIITSNYFREKNASTSVPQENHVLNDAGMGRLLTPEELDRKIEAVTGYPWTSWGAERNLMVEWRFRLLYGGIDSNTITQRMTIASGIMAGVQQRMANEMACISIPYDFSILNSESRKLLPFVERTTEPESNRGQPFSENILAIKNNIQYLYKQVIGNELPLDDPEIERVYTLFLETWREGKQEVAYGRYQKWLSWECGAYNYFNTELELPKERQVTDDENYIVRSWAAVMTYLLLDFEFLYE